MPKARYAPLILTIFLFAGYAVADIIGSLPYNLTNGTTADATQVMANYQKIIDDTNANGAHNGANSDITALLGLTTPIGPTSGGTNLWYGGSSGGSANAQTVATLVPNSFTLTAGYSAVFTAGFTNTGATTLALNGTTAKNVFRRTQGGAIALVGGEIVSGAKTMVTYDGTQYQIVSPIDATTGPRTDLASATTTDLGTIGSRNINITGTTTITALGSSATTAYPIYNLRFNGALTLTHNGTSLILPGAGNISTQAGDAAIAMYLGSGNWAVPIYQRAVMYPQTGQLARINVYVANDTWTRGTGERSVLFQCAGGGGAGGGAGDTAADQSSGGGGGGAGGFARLYVTAPAASYALTIGAGGTGSSAAAGGNGGNTTVGAILTCSGGSGGGFQAPAAGSSGTTGGAGGAATGGDLNVAGGRGGGEVGSADAGANYWALGGSGGSNNLGAGATTQVAVGGGNATLVPGNICGGGGSGGASVESAGAAGLGAAGGVGCVIAYTYY